MDFHAHHHRSRGSWTTALVLAGHSRTFGHGRFAADNTVEHGFFKGFSVRFCETRPIRVQNHGNS